MKLPIDTIHLFPGLDRELIMLLRSLKPEDWRKPTLAKKWTVKDIAAHLLDVNMRTISSFRDGFKNSVAPPNFSYLGLVDYLDQLNKEWVTAMERISPAVLIELLELTGSQFHQCLAKLQPFEKALFPVAWAGEAESLNWFHVAREFTEKWHHQKQIREAVKVDGLMGSDYFVPVIQTFMQAMPHAYRSVMANEGSVVSVIVEGYEELTFHLKKNKLWHFVEQGSPSEVAINVGADVIWKLLTKGISSEEARQRVKTSGLDNLISPFFQMVAVMG